MKLGLVHAVTSAFALAALFMHAGPAQALACTCVPPEVLAKDFKTDYFPRAQLIAIGVAGGTSGEIATVKIEEGFKGAETGAEAQVNGGSGDCAFTIAPPGSRFFILALTRDPNGVPTTNVCTIFDAQSQAGQILSSLARAEAAAAASPTPETQSTPAATPSSSPTAALPTSTPASSTSDGDDSSNATIWIVVGVLVALAVVGAAGGFAWYRRQR
jgi:hypothetical protein